MTSYGYIIMTIVDSCMIWFDFDCIMQLQKSYHIATNVCSRKSATTFGDLPDWKRRRNVAARRLIVLDSNIPEFIKRNILGPLHWDCTERQSQHCQKLKSVTHMQSWLIL